MIDLLGDQQQAPVALLTETADGWFPRFGFRPVPREALPAALSASAELRGACPATARALLRRA
jgi:amino-acid N-acetyltransferase